MSSRTHNVVRSPKGSRGKKADDGADIGSPKATRKARSHHSMPLLFTLDPPHWLKPYLASGVSKQAGEWFFLWYSLAWVAWFGIVVLTQIYIDMSDLGFALIGLSVCVPCIVIPIIWPAPIEAHIPWHQRYSFKANVWMAAFNFIGNYFWTHYFFALLGAKYTFPVKYTLNQIPPVCFLLTQAYFHTYHATSNILLRFIHRKMESSWLRFFTLCAAVLFQASVWSFLETWTIQSVPYYSFVDRDRMYTVGTFFYALYFIVSFPMFFRLDETKAKWDWQRALIDALAAAMIVFTLCDFWRLIVGNILQDKTTTTLPFLREYI